MCVEGRKDDRENGTEGEREERSLKFKPLVHLSSLSHVSLCPPEDALTQQIPKAATQPALRTKRYSDTEED